MCRTRMEFKIILIHWRHCLKTGGLYWAEGEVALGNASTRGQEGEVKLGNRWLTNIMGDVTMGWEVVAGWKRKCSRMLTRKDKFPGHEWCIFNTQGNYPALSSSELQLEFGSTFLTRQHTLRNLTRSQRNFMKTTSVFAGLTCEEGLKELGLFSLGRSLWRNKSKHSNM